MSDHYQARISGPHTHRLTDMGGVMQDLRWVQQACSILLPLIANPKADTVVMEALQSAAIVRYCRCHTKGVRTGFLVDGDLIKKLPEHLRKHHEYVDAIRDKHLAHSVNDWELNIPFAQVKVDGDSKEVVAVHVQNHSMLGLASTDMELLRDLAKRLHDLVRAEYEAERERVLKTVKQIPIEDIEARLQDPTPLPGLGPVDRARGR